MYINRARQGYTEPSEKSKQEKLRKRKEKGHTDKQTTTSKKTKEMNNTSSLVAQQQRRQRQKYKQTIIIFKHALAELHDYRNRTTCIHRNKNPLPDFIP